jgi:TolA-binding protein
MNTSTILSAALAAGVFFAVAPMRAQAPALSSTQKLEVQIAGLQAQVNQITGLQAQVNALQAQVKRLQAEVRVLAPRRGVTPIDQMPLPNFTVPKFTVPNMTLPNNQQRFIVPHTQSRNGSIPDYTASLIMQSAH